MGRIQICRLCGAESGDFYKGRTECTDCSKVANMLSHAKRNIKCGNGQPCEPDCVRHTSYSGLEFDIFDRVEFFKWARPQMQKFLRPSIDRIDPATGYVCRKKADVKPNRFGNIQIIELSENLRRARRGNA